MIALTASEAFEAYEAVRHRLPAADRAPRVTRRIATLGEIADEFDVFLLDAFGVLNIGETAIPGAPGRVAELQAAGKRVMVVSNAASVPGDALEAKYRRLGFEFGRENIVTSRATLAAHMDADDTRLWGAMATGDAALETDIRAAGLRVLGDRAEDYDAVDGFLLIGSGGWTEERQGLLEASLAARPRPVRVANPDIVAPRETGFSAEPGHFAHRLADRTGVEPEFYGKPFANIYDLAFARLGHVDRARVVMVGDSLHTDVLGAQTAGVSSALMADYGFFAGEDAEAAVARAGIVPDFIVERP